VIYGMGGSTCTQRVLMSALENGAEFEIRTVDLRKGEHKQSAHLNRQPSVHKAHAGTWKRAQRSSRCSRHMSGKF